MIARAALRLIKKVSMPATLWRQLPEREAILMKSIIWLGAMLALLGILALAIPVFTTSRT